MIVNHTAEGWSIVAQRSHGLLAGQICAYWKKENQPKRWIDTLIATAEHDDSHNELEDENLLEKNGGPKNFGSDSDEEESFDAAYCDNLINKAITKGRYITLLISRHIQFLYAEDKTAKSYIDLLQKKEEKWLKEAICSKDEVNRSYKLLEFCDAFSLLICQQKIPPEQRKIEISNGPDDTVYETYRNKSGQLIVKPWPFEADEFSVFYEIRLIPQLSFKNTKEFKTAFLEAPVQLCEVIISKS